MQKLGGHPGTGEAGVWGSQGHTVKTLFPNKQSIKQKNIFNSTIENQAVGHLQPSDLNCQSLLYTTAVQQNFSNVYVLYLHC